MRCLIILFICTSIYSYSQNKTEELSEIHFHSSYEQKQFELFFNQKETNYLELLVASDPNGNESLSTEIRQKFDKTFSDGYVAKLRKRPAAKKVKSIYEAIHKTLLDKYEAQNYFTNVIQNGSYNCVTATALYALAFEKLEIPYILQERPTHVYALAYPATEQILVESTDPVGGFMSFNERYKSSFVNQMTKAKLIGTNESRNKSIETLFDEYYFSDNDIAIVELIGIQYMNQGIYALNNGKREKALDHFEKAYLLYSNEKIESVLLITRLQELAQSNFTEHKDAILFAKLEAHKNLGITNEIILNEFQRAMYKLLTENSNINGAEEFYSSLINRIFSDSLSNDISHHYFYERARILHNQGNYSSSLTYSLKAIELKPENHNTESLFISSLSQKIRSTSDFKVVQKELEDYKKKHDQLMGNNLFASMLANTYLVLFGQSYDFRQLKAGEKYRELFKGVFKPGLNIDQNYVGRAYSMAAVYYFRLGNKRKALELLEEGLGIAPGNYELQTRQRMIR